MIDRRAWMLGAASLTGTWSAPARGSFCAPDPRLPPQASTLFENAEADIEAGRIRLSGRHLRVGSAHQLYSIAKVGGDPGHLRFEVRTGERAFWDILHSAKVDRSEVVNNDSLDRVAYGRRFWWSFNMLVETGEIMDWCVTGQLHHSGVHPGGAGVNPPFAFGWGAEGARDFGIFLRSASTASTVRPYVKPAVVYKDDAFPRGVWVHWMLEFLFDWSGAAAFRAWRDGKLVVDRVGPRFTLGYEWDSGPDAGVYPQFGIYRNSPSIENGWRSTAPHPMIVHFADFNFSLQKPFCLR